MGLRRWLVKDLYRGDMRALQQIARRRLGDIDIDQLDRLRKRGYITQIFWGPARVTPKGLFALLLRMSLARSSAGFNDG